MQVHLCGAYVNLFMNALSAIIMPNFLLIAILKNISF